MSFRCDGCGKSTPNGTPQNKRVVKTRNKTYTTKVEGRYGQKTIVVGHGVETVKEVNLCKDCATALDKLSYR